MPGIVVPIDQLPAIDSTVCVVTGETADVRVEPLDLLLPPTSTGLGLVFGSGTSLGANAILSVYLGRLLRRAFGKRLRVYVPLSTSAKEAMARNRAVEFVVPVVWLIVSSCALVWNGMAASLIAGMVSFSLILSPPGAILLFGFVGAKSPGVVWAIALAYAGMMVLSAVLRRRWQVSVKDCYDNVVLIEVPSREGADEVNRWVGGLSLSDRTRATVDEMLVVADE